MYCKHCGNQIDKETLYCPYCGGMQEKSKNSSSFQWKRSDIFFYVSLVLGIVSALLGFKDWVNFSIPYLYSGDFHLFDLVKGMSELSEYLDNTGLYMVILGLPLIFWALALLNFAFVLYMFINRERKVKMMQRMSFSTICLMISSCLAIVLAWRVNYLIREEMDGLLKMDFIELKKMPYVMLALAAVTRVVLISQFYKENYYENQ
ncbi:MAG: zinc ribbon domain-containing protein [bacterium]|nr:zinc ribbon domain-containing protein [bacterium]